MRYLDVICLGVRPDQNRLVEAFRIQSWYHSPGMFVYISQAHG